MSGQQQQLPKFRKKLTVLSLKELHRGRGAKGEWVMFEVEALDESGKRVDQAGGGVPLRTFDATIEVNKLIEYEVQPKDTDRHGRTYTLFKHDRPGLPQRVDDLERRVRELEELVRQLRNSGPQSEPPAPPQDPPPAPVGPKQTW